MEPENNTDRYESVEIFKQCCSGQYACPTELAALLDRFAVGAKPGEILFMKERETGRADRQTVPKTSAWVFPQS